MTNPVISLIVEGDQDCLVEFVHELIGEGISFWYSATIPSIRVVLRSEYKIRRLERECKGMGLKTSKKTNDYN